MVFIDLALLTLAHGEVAKLLKRIGIICTANTFIVITNQPPVALLLLPCPREAGRYYRCIVHWMGNWCTGGHTAIFFSIFDVGLMLFRMTA